MRLNHGFAALLLASALPIATPGGAQDAAPGGVQDARAQFSATDLPELQMIGDIDPTLRKAQAIVNGDVITDTDIDQRVALVLAANGGNIAENE